MAESEAVQRARALTNIDSGIISTSDMTTLEETAKDEIRADTSKDSIDFSSAEGRSALMWLICLFAKVHIGEIGADGYSIGDLETKDLDRQSETWFRNYRSARNTLIGGNVIRHAKPNRSGRSYGSDSNRGYGDE